MFLDVSENNLCKIQKWLQGPLHDPAFCISPWFLPRSSDRAPECDLEVEGGGAEEGGEDERRRGGGEDR